MAFKRYIHKHGKKLGPYYYENVRSNDGKVKTVYLGTNPSHHPKHRIRKPLFFLILVLMLILILGGSLFLLQNKSYLINKVNAQEPDFEIDQILLKVLIRSGEFIEKQVRIMNIADKPAGIDVIVSGLEDIVKVGAPSFAIKPGQTKIVALTFSSLVPEQGIEQQPGIYVGKLIAKSEKAAREVPIVVEIETKNVLFDMNLNPVAVERRVKQGSDATIEVRLFNLESIDSQNVDVEYFVKDINGNTIITESETVVVKTQASFFKTISIPKNLKPGQYVFAAITRFGNSIGTSSYLFEVMGPEIDSSFVQFCKNSVLCLGLSLTTILLLFALIAYFYFFIGAYLYEKVTGVVTIPRKGKPEAQEEIEKAGIFERISAKIREWRERSERKKAGKESLERGKELQKLAEERNAQLEAKRRQIEEENGKREALRKQKDLERQEEERLRKKQLEKENASKARKEKFRALLHGIGLFRTPEEKKQIELKKQKEAQEKQKQQLEAEKIRQEGQKIREQLERQEEQERQKALEQKRKFEEEKKTREEERKRKEEQEKRQKEAESQKQELAKAQKLSAIKQLEEKLARNNEVAEQLRKELRKAESEKRSLSSANNEIGMVIKRLDHEILDKSRRNEELGVEKNSLFEKYQKQLGELAKNRESQKAAKESRIKELREKLAAKQESLVKELEEELSRLTPQKRKTTEKWKRLELKAKLKIEEQNIEEGIRKEGESEGKKPIGDNYKKSIEDLGRKQADLKHEIAELESQKQQTLLEKKNVPRELASKEGELQGILSKLEGNAREKKELSAELSKLRAELSKFSIHFIKSIVAGYKEKAEKAREEREEEKARLEAEKRKEEEITRKEKEIGEKARRLDEERKSREEERKKAFEDRIRLQEEKKRLKEAEKQEKAEKLRREAAFEETETVPEELEKEPEEKPGIFARIFRREKPEARESEIKEASREKPKSEAEELEEAIKSLDLFKEMEKDRRIREKPGMFKGIFKPKEKASEEKASEKPKKVMFGKLFGKAKKPAEEIKETAAEKPKSRPRKFKSRKLEKFYSIMDNAKAAMGKNEVPKAKKLYLDARNFYIGLEYEEKKEVYDELTKLYNRLSK